MHVPSKAQTRRSLRLSVLDGALYAVMLGTSESYLGAFAVALGHDSQALAILSTLPMVVGAFAQLLAGTVVRALGGHKRLVAAAAALQALAHLGFIAIALTSESALLPLLVTKVLFWTGASIGAPAWSAWMAKLTARVPRERYFARRSLILNVVLLVSFLAAGGVLELGRASERTLPAFALLFAAALVARALSATALALKHDPGGDIAGALTVVTRAREAFRVPGARIAVVLALLHLGTYVSAPFYTPFMLQRLEMGYLEFSLLTAVSILAKALSFLLWRHASRRFGLLFVLVAGVSGATTLALMWALHPSFGMILGAQALGGLSWGAVEFASFQLLLKTTRDDLRVEFFSLSNCLTGAAQLAGALTGGALLERGLLDYQPLFLISSAGRALSLLALFGAPAALLVVKPTAALVTRMLSVRPSAGAVARPLVDNEGDERSGAE